MKKLAAATLIVIFSLSIASAQSNKIVFGPLEGDDAGVLTVHNGEAIEIEMWVRTDPDNPAPIIGISHCLMSADTIIASRNGATFDPDYSYPCWNTFVSPPFGHPDYPDLPEGHTIQAAGAMHTVFDPPCDSIDTNGEWDYYGAFLMTCNTGLPTDETYYPFSMGWYPHSGEGTKWAFAGGGGIEPEQSYCGLYFEPYPCLYIPGDCDHNSFPIELTDVLAMIGFYRGNIEPDYLCGCGEDPIIHDFAATADPNGNCAPNELLDVVTEIAAYRGTMTASGCPDCPGSEGLVKREDEGQ